MYFFFRRLLSDHHWNWIFSSSNSVLWASIAASLNFSLQNNKKYTFYYFNNSHFHNTLFSLSTLTIHFHYFIKILFFKDLFFFFFLVNFHGCFIYESCHFPQFLFGIYSLSLRFTQWWDSGRDDSGEFFLCWGFWEDPKLSLV